MTERAPPPVVPEEPAQGAKRVAVALLVLTASLLPEVVTVLVFGVLGLVLGTVVGVASTSELLHDGGVWGRAGAIALVLPFLTLLGPPVLGLLGGLFIPLPIALAVHSLVLVPFPRRDRHIVVWATGVGYWLPVLGAATLPAAFGHVVVFGPFTAAIALVLSVAWFGSRVVLNGRSVAVWWREGDRSMLNAALLFLGVGAGIIWGSCVMFPLLPVSPFLLVMSAVLAARLQWLGRRRAVSATVLVFAILHLGVVGAAVAFVATQGRNRSEPTPSGP